jgi:hypothetical protein
MQGIAISKHNSAAFEEDRAREAQYAARQHDKINMSQTKSALHRTRLQVLHHKNFSVLFFYKFPHLSAPWLAFCQSSPIEKNEKNFSDFQF